MLIHLYESVINKDGSRSADRLVAEIRCKGDGTPGEFVYFDTCKDYRQVWDTTHSCYGDKTEILSDLEKRILERTFNKSRLVLTDGGTGEDGVEYTAGVTLTAWTRKGIEEAITYQLPGTICGKIIEN